MYTVLEIVVWPHELQLSRGHVSFSYGTSLGLRRASLYSPLAIWKADKRQRGRGMS